MYASFLENRKQSIQVHVTYITKITRTEKHMNKHPTYSSQPLKIKPIAIENITFGNNYIGNQHYRLIYLWR